MEFLLAEDRHTLRHSVTVNCQVVRENGFTLLGERAVDLSPGGMLLASSQPAELGEPVIVTFQVPGTSRWIDTEGSVVRFVRGRRQSDYGRGLGISFAPLASDDELRVRHALRRLAPPFPARPTRIDYAATVAMIALSFHY